MLTKLNSLLGRYEEKFQVISWTIFRLLTASMFMTHGYAKLFGENPQPFTGGGMTSINIGEVISFPLPGGINALFIAGLIEFFAGLMIFVGFRTRLAALVTMLELTIAYLIAHLAWFPTLNGGELAGLYFVAFMVILAAGAGPFSADAWLTKRAQQKTRPASGN
ncbi:MAG TPA: hypothetical protein DCS89_04650 [Gammaproteobacteria bacterium]|nr:hypothetical protein [Gammaproteobacteria bacterium]HAT26282.1 hypothetical protein [Gammaproteobacteria bacterium]